MNFSGSWRISSRLYGASSGFLGSIDLSIALRKGNGQMTTPNNEPNNPYSSGGNQNWSQPNSAYQPPQYQGQNQQQFGNQPGYGYPMVHPEGAQLAQTSMILGIISLFVVGIVLGPIAIVKANRAEREFNTSATVGKVTGWIGTIFGALGFLYIIFIILAVFVSFPVAGGFDY